MRDNNKNNREFLLSLAEQAGARFDAIWGLATGCGTETFIRFAKFVAMAERDACAKRWEKAHGFDKNSVAKWLRSNDEVQARAPTEE